MVLLIPLLAAMIPFLAWPIEYFIGMPFLVEEIFKAVVVWFLPKLSLGQKVITIVICGILFAFSESIFYLFNITDSHQYLQRLALTVPLHVITWLVIVLSAHKNKKLVLVGLFLAIGVHYFYNLYVILLPAR